MATQEIGGTGARAPRATGGHRRLSTETKSAFKTTELIAFAAVAVGLVIAGAMVDQNNEGGLGARQVWLYLTLLTIGYMISRGLAKSGSRDPYDDDDNNGRGSNR